MGYEPNSLKLSLPKDEEIQFREPSFHSYTNPNIKIERKNIRLTHKLRLVARLIILQRIGISKATSTSKIRKITTNIKNRIENGLRVWLNGSKPHSKAVSFLGWWRLGSQFIIYPRRGRIIIHKINSTEIVKIIMVFQCPHWMVTYNVCYL